MRGVSTVAMAVGLVAVAVSTITAVQGQPTLTVQDPKNRFTISVPVTWHVQTSTAAFVPAVSATAPAPAGELPDSVDVAVQDFTTPITVSACATAGLRLLRVSIRTWTTLEEGPVTFNGLQAYNRDYEWRTSTDAPRRSIQICLPVGRRVFLLVGTTANTRTAIQQDLPLVKNIMATFRPVLATLPPATPTPGQQR